MVEVVVLLVLLLEHHSRKNLNVRLSQNVQGRLAMT